VLQITVPIEMVAGRIERRRGDEHRLHWALERRSEHTHVLLPRHVGVGYHHPTGVLVEGQHIELMHKCRGYLVGDPRVGCVPVHGHE